MANTVQTSPPSLLHTNYSTASSQDRSNSQMNPSNNRCPARQQQPLQFISGNSYRRRREKTEVDRQLMNLIKTDSAECPRPCCLMAVCNDECTLRLVGDLCQVEIDLWYFFGVLVVLGALCCHSEINELDEISAWILHSSIIAAHTGRFIFSGLEEAWRTLWEVVLQE